MIIDFHTHAFPDELAERAVSSLLATLHNANSDLSFSHSAPLPSCPSAVQANYRTIGCRLSLPDSDFPEVMYTDGTAKGIINSMDKAGIDISVLLPVATKPTQPKGINSWARSFAEKEPRIIPFGAVFPDETAETQLEELAEKGYKGIKLHGDFQGFYADDEKMLPIYRRCAEYGLICVMHAGLDCVSPHDIHVTPERMARVLDKVSGVKFVLAHMGGNCIEDRAADILGGADGVWVDTAYAAGRIAPGKMAELVGKYGADRVLFASDSPWNDPADDIALIRSTPISESDREKILYKNAQALLGVQ